MPAEMGLFGHGGREKKHLTLHCIFKLLEQNGKNGYPRQDGAEPLRSGLFGNET
jgi:hypothetical protein